MKSVMQTSSPDFWENTRRSAREQFFGASVATEVVTLQFTNHGCALIFRRHSRDVTRVGLCAGSPQARTKVAHILRVRSLVAGDALVVRRLDLAARMRPERAACTAEDGAHIKRREGTFRQYESRIEHKPGWQRGDQQRWTIAEIQRD